MTYEYITKYFLPLVHISANNNAVQLTNHIILFYKLTYINYAIPLSNRESTHHTHTHFKIDVHCIQ